MRLHTSTTKHQTVYVMTETAMAHDAPMTDTINTSASVWQHNTSAPTSGASNSTAQCNVDNNMPHDMPNSTRGSTMRYPRPSTSPHPITACS